MATLDADPLFAALTRPQMFMGVSYSFFVLNLVATTEIFLVTRSIWAIAAAVILHSAAYAICLNEPRFLDLWLLRVSRCPRVPNFERWRCNTYAP